MNGQQAVKEQAPAWSEEAARDMVERLGRVPEPRRGMVLEIWFSALTFAEHKTHREQDQAPAERDQ